MAKTIVLTASGVVKGGSGTLWGVNVTKVATGTGVVRVWDNATTNTGGKLFEGDGLTQQSFNLQSAGDGTKASQGMYCELSGTTNATVTIVYD